MRDQRKLIGHLELWLNFFLRNTVIIVQLWSLLAFPIFLATRYFFGFCLLGFGHWTSHQKIWVKPTGRRAVWSTSFWLWLASFLAFTGVAIEKMTGGTIGTVIVPSAFMTLVAFVWGPKKTTDHWHRYSWPAFLLGFLGTVCVLIPKLSYPKTLLGPLIGSMAGVGLAFYLISLRQANIQRVPALTIAFWQQLFGTIATTGLLATGWLVSHFSPPANQILMNLWTWLTAGMTAWTEWGPKQYVGLVWGGIICGAGVTYLYAAANERIQNIQLVVVLSFVEPALVAIYEVLFLKGSYHWSFFAGIPLLGLAGYLITRPEKKDEP